MENGKTDTSEWVDGQFYPYSKEKMARMKEREKKRKENRKDLEKQRKQADVPANVARQPISTKIGQKQRVQQFKEMLMTDKNGTAIISKIIEVALDDEHPNQAACLKMAIDRLLPTSLFDDKKFDHKPQISINITGIGESVTVGESGNVIDHEQDEDNG